MTPEEYVKLGLVAAAKIFQDKAAEIAGRFGPTNDHVRGLGHGYMAAADLILHLDPSVIIDDFKKPAKAGCGKKLALGQYWTFCGETDMGQLSPALCVECGGKLELMRGV